MINVIEAIEQKLQAQKDEIFFKQMQIDDLTRQLKEAENENNALRELLNESK